MFTAQMGIRVKTSDFHMGSDSVMAQKSELGYMPLRVVCRGFFQLEILTLSSYFTPDTWDLL